MKVIALTALCLSASVALAGELDPPPGPVAPTMKTLDEVEPRTALSAERTPGDVDHVFIIDEPGSYYLAGNLDVPSGMSGVRVESDRVTLDLNGFLIEGVPGSVAGVVLDSNDVTVRDGRIGGFDGDGIESATIRVRNTVEGLEVIFCGGHGINLNGTGATVRRCEVSNTGGNGIFTTTNASVTECSVVNAGEHGIRADDGSIVSGNRVSGAGFSGIDVDNSCVVTGNNVNSGNHGISCQSLCSLSGNHVRFATNDGIRVAANSFVRDNSAVQCGTGFRASSVNNLVDSNYAFGNDIGFNSTSSTNSFMRNTSLNNTNADYNIGGALQGPIVTGSGVIVSEHPWANFGS